MKVIRAASVRVFMVTGDFMNSAAAIAKKVFNCIFPLQTVL